MTKPKTTDDHLEASVISDMTFFYYEADAAMGLRSSHSSFIARLEGQSNTANLDPMINIDFKKVRRYSQICHTLTLCSTQTRRILDALYNPIYPWVSWKTDWRRSTNDPPPPLVKIYGKKCACALFTKHTDDLQYLLKLVSKKTQKILTPEEHKLSFLIGKEIDELYHSSHQEYATLRKDS